MVVDHAEIVDDVRCGDARVLVKGKRTKRQRPLSPFESRISTSCSSSAGGAGEEGDAATTSDEPAMIISTEEEQDMARCLILLAKSGDGGGGGKLLPDVLTPVTRSGFYVYECKTCNCIFPSFQALGGHRASHKKSKPLPPTTVEPAPPVLAVHDFDEEERQFCKTALLPQQLHLHGKTPTRGATGIASTNKQKVHECSICGSEFGSGQALGGHMRRHRMAKVSRSSDVTSTGNSPVSDEKLSRNVLPLDLNLPAPEDDRIGLKFWFGLTQQPPILFPEPGLVDCHY